MSRWREVTIGEVAEVQSGSGFPKQYQGESNGHYPFFKVSDMNLPGNERFMVAANNYISDAVRVELQAKVFPPGSIIFPKIGAAIATNKKRVTTRPCCVDNNVVGVIPDSETVVSDYFYYWFIQHDLSEFANESELPSIRKTTIEAHTIRLPSLVEQKRIVSLLDEAFAAIDTATAHARQNLTNARELFESHLNAVFAEQCLDWPEKTLGELCELISGRHILAKEYNVVGRGIAYLTGPADFGTVHPTVSKWTEHPQAVAKAGDILITVKGAGVGKLNLQDIAEAAISRQLMAIRLNGTNPKFVYAFLRFSFEHFQSLGQGATVPGLSRSHILGLRIRIPDQQKQAQVMSRMDLVQQQSDQLATLYTRKLELLAELKQSLLHKAFSGEMASEFDAPAPFPFIIPDISPTDLHAGILAIAYREHEAADVLKFFGHVKGEKIAHMIEAHLGIELGRTPVKDAAGPNDYPHLKKVEHRARMAGYFDVKRRGEKYELTPKRGFDRLIEKTASALGDRAAEVERLIEIMLPMDTRQAEIFATVYAAWNNLLLDGLDPTDEQIVCESRDNWHEDKLKIPKERFIKAIRWLRDNQFVPQGRGRKVRKGSVDMSPKRQNDDIFSGHVADDDIK